MSLTKAHPRIVEDILTRVNNIAGLKSLKHKDSPANLLGYYKPGDGGGGRFYWDANSTETDNGGTIIQANDTNTGRWIRITDSNRINLKAFGAKNNFDDTTPNKSFDNRPILQAAIDYVSESNEVSEIFVSFGTYNINSIVTTGVSSPRAIILRDRVSIIGRSSNNCFFAPGPDILALQDPVEAFFGTLNESVTSGNEFIYDVELNNLTIDGLAKFNYAVKIGSHPDDPAEPSSNSVYGVRCHTKDLIARNGLKSAMYFRSFLSTHRNITAEWSADDEDYPTYAWDNEINPSDAPTGIHFHGSTTNIIEIAYGQGYTVGVKYEDLSYSTVSGCAADFCEIPHFAQGCDNTTFNFGSEWGKVAAIIRDCDQCSFDIRALFCGVLSDSGQDKASHYSSSFPDYALFVSQSNINITNFDVQTFQLYENIPTGYFAKNLIGATFGSNFITYTGSVGSRDFRHYPLPGTSFSRSAQTRSRISIHHVDISVDEPGHRCGLYWPGINGQIVNYRNYYDTSLNDITPFTALIRVSSDNYIETYDNSIFRKFDIQQYISIVYPDGNPGTQIVDLDYETQVIVKNEGTGTVSQFDSDTINIQSIDHGLSTNNKINISNENSWYGASSILTVTVVDDDNFRVDLPYASEAETQAIRWVLGGVVSNLTVNRSSDVMGNDPLNLNITEYSDGNIQCTTRRFHNYMYGYGKIVQGYTYKIHDSGTGLDLTNLFDAAGITSLNGGGTAVATSTGYPNSWGSDAVIIGIFEESEVKNSTEFKSSSTIIIREVETHAAPDVHNSTAHVRIL